MKLNKSKKWYISNVMNVYNEFEITGSFRSNWKQLINWNRFIPKNW